MQRTARITIRSDGRPAHVSERFEADGKKEEKMMIGPFPPAAELDTGKSVVMAYLGGKFILLPQTLDGKRGVRAIDARDWTGRSVRVAKAGVSWEGVVRNYRGIDNPVTVQLDTLDGARMLDIVSPDTVEERKPGPNAAAQQPQFLSMPWMPNVTAIGVTYLLPQDKLSWSPRYTGLLTPDLSELAALRASALILNRTGVNLHVDEVVLQAVPTPPVSRTPMYERSNVMMDAAPPAAMMRQAADMPRAPEAQITASFPIRLKRLPAHAQVYRGLWPEVLNHIPVDLYYRFGPYSLSASQSTTPDSEKTGMYAEALLAVQNNSPHQWVGGALALHVIPSTGNDLRLLASTELPELGQTQKGDISLNETFAVQLQPRIEVTTRDTVNKREKTVTTRQTSKLALWFTHRDAKSPSRRVEVRLLVPAVALDDSTMPLNAITYASTIPNSDPWKNMEGSTNALTWTRSGRVVQFTLLPLQIGQTTLVRTIWNMDLRTVPLATQTSNE